MTIGRHIEEFVEVIQKFSPTQSVVPVFHCPTSLAIISSDAKLGNVY